MKGTRKLLNVKSQGIKIIGGGMGRAPVRVINTTIYAETIF